MRQAVIGQINAWQPKTHVFGKSAARGHYTRRLGHSGHSRFVCEEGVPNHPSN